MFSERFWGIKAGLAALGFLLLCRWSEEEVRRDYPTVESIPARSPGLIGRPVSVSAKKVLDARLEWVEISTSSGPMRLIGQASPAARPGDTVSATGVVTGPREIRTQRLRVHPGYAWKRPLNYAVSIVTLLGFLLWAAPLFRTGPADGLIRSRH